MNITRERKEIISSFERKSSLESLAQSIPEWPSPSRFRNLSFTHDGYIRHTATERIILMTDISVIYGTQRVKVWKRLLKIQDLLKTLRPACEPWSSTKWRLMISMIVHGSYRDERNCVSHVHSLHVSQWISRLSYFIGCPKSQSSARLREIAKINTRKIIAIPKSQNFVLANNSNNNWISRPRNSHVTCAKRFSTTPKAPDWTVRRRGRTGAVVGTRRLLFFYFFYWCLLRVWVPPAFPWALCKTCSCSDLRMHIHVLVEKEIVREVARGDKPYLQ